MIDSYILLVCSMALLLLAFGLILYMDASQRAAIRAMRGQLWETRPSRCPAAAVVTWCRTFGRTRR